MAAVCGVTQSRTRLKRLSSSSSSRSPKKRRERGPEKISEAITAENFPNMGKEIVNQVQEAQRIPGRINPRRKTLRHVVIKLTKIKNKIKY